MPQRNRQQQEKHNVARRRLSRVGKKAIFSTQYINAFHPELIEEAGKLYDFLIELHPRKHDLTKTDIYVQCIKNKSVRKRILQTSAETRNTNNMMELQPVLKIPLMQSLPALQPPLLDQATSTITEEIPVDLPILTDDETDALIRDLQQDPTLKQFFQEEYMGEVTIATENPKAEPTTLEDEIAQIIDEEFEALGRDLLDITVNDELFFQ